MLIDGITNLTLHDISGSDDVRDVQLYFQAFPVNWQAQSSAHALLLNEAGRLEFGGASFEYLLNTFAKFFGGASFEYILGRIVNGDLISSGSAVSSMVPIITYLVSAISSGSGISVVIGQRVADALAASSVTGSSVSFVNIVAQVIAASVAVINGVFILDGEEYDVWAFNSETFAASRYTNYNFNSFASHQGRHYGANSEGVYELSGVDDAGIGINASIMFGRINFGTSQLKRMFRAYIGGTSDGKMMLRVVGDDGNIRTYTTKLPLGMPIRYRRIEPAKGLTAHYWQFEIRNEGGENFELDGVDLYPIVLQRRVK